MGIASFADGPGVDEPGALLRRLVPEMIVRGVGNLSGVYAATAASA
ncbi:hypothetical protein [Paeniglutamicibacter cryotolerans]|uniref:Uncharacterized protein n=1 Tax=Paeniglutamicibacter cryotolerans TaxID=670079 RepID=A0A839QMS3_9MICC|nr:hypothetical protein [Paeniglutamicibacter cryotolerans]MBB2994512.1 hypothetical protein [Paeniglutamicibacter cryotolerans]